MTALEQSRALDVPGRLRLLDLVAQDALGSPGRVEPAVARELARRLGAQLVLIPEVRRIGPEVVLQVRGLDPGKLDPLFVVEERTPGSGEGEAIPELVDRIAGSVRQAQRDGGGPAGTGKTAAVTRNLEAYRHYLLGQQFANETFDVPAAIAEYKAAIAADPEFAMPHLEMAILAGWHDAPDEDQRTHMATAAKSAGKLPDKERRLILGYKAFVEQRYTEATRLLDALALDYPLDKQVLYLAGEAFWHGDTPAGFARAASLFRTALDLDPAYLVAYIHLFEWLDRFGPRGEALARAERAAKLRPSAEAQAMVARALGATDRWPEALTAARSAIAISRGEHFESSYAQAEVVFGAGDHAEAERSLRTWLSPTAGPGQRRVAAEVLAPLLARLPDCPSRPGRRLLQARTSRPIGMRGSSPGWGWTTRRRSGRSSSRRGRSPSGSTRRSRRSGAGVTRTRPRSSPTSLAALRMSSRSSSSGWRSPTRGDTRRRSRRSRRSVRGTRSSRERPSTSSGPGPTCSPRSRSPGWSGARRPGHA
ncbi:MAG: serine/threonine protein kinase, partial [Anaeromyxobacteraceae bacterium]|nr:serine/threonine protein kinase [Anaeromyxobacteraceae bacterium]